MVRLIKEASPWTHLELGAADYGEKGAVGVAGEDERPIKPRGELQYETLYNTVDDLINKRGPKGVFFLNDLNRKDCEYAAYKLRQYIHQHHPNSVDVRIQIIAKNYCEINILDDCHHNSIGSVHLKNPDLLQLKRNVLVANKWICSLLPFVESGYLELFTAYPVGSSFGPVHLSTKHCMAGGREGSFVLRYEMAGGYPKYTYRFPPPIPSQDYPLCYRIRKRFSSEVADSSRPNLLAFHTVRKAFFEKH